MIVLVSSTLGVIGALGIAGMIFVWKKCMVIVPAGTYAIVEKWGRMSRVLDPGMHFVSYPSEKLRAVSWRYFGEDADGNRTVERVSGRFIFVNYALDAEPYSGLTSDRVNVDLNGTLHYQIVDVHRAVYETPNLLGHLTDCIQAATREVLSKRTHMELIGHDKEIAYEMLTIINKHGEPYGVRCTEFLVQDISMDKRITTAIEKAIVDEREKSVTIAKEHHEREMRRERFLAEQKRVMEEMEAAEAREHREILRQRKRSRAQHESEQAKIEALKMIQTQQHEQKLAALRHAHEQEEAEQARKIQCTRAECAIRTEEAEAEHRRAVLKAEAEHKALMFKAQAEAEDIRAMIMAGLGPEHVVAIKTAPFLATAVGKQDKVVIAPPDVAGSLCGYPLASLVQQVISSSKETLAMPRLTPTRAPSPSAPKTSRAPSSAARSSSRASSSSAK